VTLAELNAMDREAFVAALGWVFEHSPWVAERAWSARPFASAAALHAAMVQAVAGAAPEDQLSLIRAHPDLGTRARLSAASAAEQTNVGLDSLDAEEFERHHRLNTAYRERFGFPFLFAVRGSTKQQILAALESRVHADPQAEHAVALEQIYRIAKFRLEDFLNANLCEWK